MVIFYVARALPEADGPYLTPLVRLPLPSREGGWGLGHGHLHFRRSVIAAPPQRRVPTAPGGCPGIARTGGGAACPSSPTAIAPARQSLKGRSVPAGRADPF